MYSGMVSRNCSTKCGSSGRGPTRLISPRSTFHSWGSSSRLHLRMKLPNYVLRGSLSVVHAVSCCVLTRILRNFSIWKFFR